MAKVEKVLFTQSGFRLDLTEEEARDLYLAIHHLDNNFYTGAIERIDAALCSAISQVSATPVKGGN